MTIKSTPIGKIFIRAIKTSISIAVLIFLAYQLNQIGFKNILNSLPSKPLFYALFVLGYFTLPLSEVIIYGFSISFKFFEAIKVFIMKQILNAELIAYSGEAYLLAMGKKKWGLRNMSMLHLVKDNNLISSFVAYTSALCLIGTLIYFKQIDFIKTMGIEKKLFVLSIVAFLGITIVFFLLRKKIFRYTFKMGFKVYLIQQLRLLTVHTLQILMCVTALPDIPMNVWFTMLAIQIIYSKIPFLPSQELILLGLYAKIVQMYHIPQAQVMAVFLTIAALNKMFSLIFYTYLSFEKKFQRKHI